LAFAIARYRSADNVRLVRGGDLLGFSDYHYNRHFCVSPSIL
jgi:hypothetical protein